MAKLCFENKFILTRKLHKEYCKTTYKKTRNKRKVVYGILAVLFLAVAVVAALVWKLLPVIIAAGVISLFCFYSLFFGYVLYEWFDMGRLKEEFGPAVAMVVSFYSDRVAIRVNDKKVAFKYSSITRCVETENLYIFFVYSEGIIEHGQALFKKGFKEEEIPAFQKYINERTGKEIFMGL